MSKKKQRNLSDGSADQKKDLIREEIEQEARPNTNKKADAKAKIIEESPAFAWPTVVAVVVTHNPGVWLEECLGSLDAEKYPDLTTLVMDVGSDVDITERVAAAMPSAFVKRIEEDINFAETINMAVNSIEGATYVLICHDDVVLKPGSVARLVEEAFRSNASIVGPKIIDADHPDVLLEVGGMIDRFGVPFSGIEPDEVDQGQHDGVRDVFYVSSATMLVRADLFRALGGFDTQCFPGAEDIDLAWRAHLVGARILVQPEAVIKHHEASDRQRKSRTSAKAIVARHRMRAVLKNASRASLLWIIPAAFVLHTIEGLAFLLRADPRRAYLLFRSWIWNIRHLKDTRKERAAIQKTREVSDRDIANHQIGGSARIKRFFTSIGRNRQLKKISSASRAISSNRYVQQTRESPIYLVAFLFYLISIRSLITDGIASVGGVLRWPPISDQLDALTYGGLPVAHEPMLSSTLSRLVSLLLSFLCLGNVGLAETIFIASLVPIGVQGVRLLLKDRDLEAKSIAAGALSYGTFGIGIYLFDRANLSAVLLMAALPYFVRALSHQKIRQVGLSAGVMIGFVPSAIVVCIVLSLVFVVVGHQIQADALKFGRLKALRLRLKAVLLSGLLAALINVGMIFDAFRTVDRNTLGLSNTSRSLSEYLFPNLTVTILLYISATVWIAALIVCRNLRTSDVRVIGISVVFLIAVASGLIIFAEPIFDLGAIFSLVQLLTAISFALVVHSYSDELKLRTLGMAHALATVSVTAVILGSLLSLYVLGEGRYALPGRSWANQIEVENNERVLYIGDAKYLPGQSILAPYQRSITFSGGTEISLISHRVGPASSLDNDVRDIYSSIMNQETSHAGALFARMGIGAVVIPNSLAPEKKPTAEDTTLLKAFDAQVDLVRLRDRDGLVVYMNSSLIKTYPLDTEISSFSPGSVFDDDKANPTKQPEFSKATPDKKLTWGISISTLILIWLCIVWPRRKGLLDSTSSWVRVVAKNQKVDNELDQEEKLESGDNENIDEFNQEPVEEKS